MSCEAHLFLLELLAGQNNYRIRCTGVYLHELRNHFSEEWRSRKPYLCFFIRSGALTPGGVWIPQPEQTSNTDHSLLHKADNYIWHEHQTALLAIKMTIGCHI